MVYEIIVFGIPRSSRARSSPVWKNQVSSNAKNICTTPLEGNDLVIDVTVYYHGLPTFDNDNVLKPICDALIGICYHDDHQLSDHRIKRRPLQGYSGSIQNVSPKLLAAFRSGRDFVHIVISRVNLSEEELN